MFKHHGLDIPVTLQDGRLSFNCSNIKLILERVSRAECSIALNGEGGNAQFTAGGDVVTQHHYNLTGGLLKRVMLPLVIQSGTAVVGGVLAGGAEAISGGLASLSLVALGGALGYFAGGVFSDALVGAGVVKSQEDAKIEIVELLTAGLDGGYVFSSGDSGNGFAVRLMNRVNGGFVAALQNLFTAPSDAHSPEMVNPESVSTYL